MAGQRKELCAHARPSVTFTHMLREKVVFISRPKVAFPGSQAVERKKKDIEFLKLNSFAVIYQSDSNIQIQFAATINLCSRKIQ